MADRWTVELNFRSLKTHLGMGILRSHTADMVRNEIALYLLAYNLIRLLMWQAARDHHRDLHRLSFTGTLHRLRTAWPLLVFRSRRCTVEFARLSSQLLAWITSDPAPD